ncbi:MAG: YdcF family protein [Novosphingobium sp.]
MLKRLVVVVLLAWALGFAWFALTLPRPHQGGKTDGVIVLTGGDGRVARGLEVLRKGWARKLLVSGVDREVKPREFVAAYHLSAAQMACCITLGFESVDTRSNAREAARWIAANKFRSVRLITTDWHMQRAAYELSLMQPKGVVVLRDAVPSQPAWGTLFTEYHKLLARRAEGLVGR